MRVRVLLSNSKRVKRGRSGQEVVIETVFDYAVLIALGLNTVLLDRLLSEESALTIPDQSKIGGFCDVHGPNFCHCITLSGGLVARLSQR